jgi:hypothetical protein
MIMLIVMKVKVMTNMHWLGDSAPRDDEQTQGLNVNKEDKLFSMSAGNKVDRILARIATWGNPAQVIYCAISNAANRSMAVDYRDLITNALLFSVARYQNFNGSYIVQMLLFMFMVVTCIIGTFAGAFFAWIDGVKYYAEIINLCGWTDFIKRAGGRCAITSSGLPDVTKTKNRRRRRGSATGSAKTDCNYVQPMQLIYHVKKTPELRTSTTSIKMQIGGGRPFVNIYFDNKVKVAALVDTGANVQILGPTLRDKIVRATNNAQLIDHFDSVHCHNGSKFEIIQKLITSIYFHGESGLEVMKDVEFHVACEDVVPILGNQLLHDREVQIHYKKRTDLFSTERLPTKG